MKRKFFMFLLAVVSCLCVAFAFSACTDSSAAVTAHAAESATICTEEHDACKTAVSSTLTASSASDCAHEYKGVLTPATCTTSSYITYTCTICGYSYTDYSLTAPKGHTYGEAVWTWAEDYSSASVTLTCTVCGEVDTAEATVTVETYSSGETVYTATATLNEVDYVDTITVEPEEPADMVVGVEYTVSLNEDTNSIATTVTTEAEGYYTVSISDNAYITIYDADGLYYYNSNRMDLGYIADNTNYDEDVPVLIPAGTTLNVVIGLISSSSSSTSVTALIDIATEEEVYNQDITLAMDPDTEQRGYVEITYTTTEAGNYTFTLSGADKEEAYAIIADENWDIYEGLNINTGTGSLVTGGIYSTTVYVGAGVELTISLSQLESDDVSSSINLTITYIYAPAPEGSSTGNTFALDEEITLSGTDTTYTITIDEAGDYMLKITLADDADIDYTSYTEDYSDLYFWVGSVYYNYSDFIVSADETYCYIKFTVTSANVGDIEINFNFYNYAGNLTYTAVVSAVEEEVIEVVEGVYNVSAAGLSSTTVSADTVIFDDEALTLSTYGGNMYYSTGTNTNTGLTVDEGVDVSARLTTSYAARGWTLTLYSSATVTIYYGISNTAQSITITGSGYAATLTTTTSNAWYVVSETLSLSAGTYTIAITGGTGAIYSIVLDEAHVHSYVAGETVAPTCNEQGYTIYTCECGDSYVSDYVDALGHTYGSVETVVTAATCTTDGSVVVNVICSVCGEAMETNVTVIPATGHYYVAVVTEPTCTEAGYTTYTCAICGDTYTEEGEAATGHVEVFDIDWDTYVDATCTEAGSYDYISYCEVCGEELSRETITIDAYGHWYFIYDIILTLNDVEIDASEIDYTNIADVKVTAIYMCWLCYDEQSVETVSALYDSQDATCTEDGYVEYVYTINFNDETDEIYISAVIPATGHSYIWDETVGATCTEDSYYKIHCEICGYETTVFISAATGHEYEAVVIAPTCTEQGYTTYNCVNCDDSYVDDYVEATGHNYVAVVTEATCTTAGYTTYTCANCGDTYTADEVAALGHTINGHSVVVDDSTYYMYIDGSETPATAEEVETLLGLTVILADCTSGAAVQGTCTVCGEPVIGMTPATEHTAAEAVIENETAETCTADGSYDSVVYCSVCNEEISRETITVPATGHKITVDNVTYTIVVSGEYNYIYIDGSTTPATAEQLEAIGFTVLRVVDCSVGRAATATCDVCGTISGMVPGTDHTYVATVTDPTCTEDGYTTYTCSVCGDSYTADATDATGHSYEEAWSWTGYTSAELTLTCTVCQTTASATASGEAITSETTTAATCTEEGVRTYTATVTIDGVEYTNTTTEAIAATGHTAADAVTENEVAATCTEDGSYDTVVYCSVCDAEISRTTTIVDATGHTAAEAVIENEVTVTCTVDGTHDEVVYCSVCGEEISRTTVIDETAVGYHTAGTSTFTVDADYYLYIDGSTTPATQSELVAIGGSLLTTDCTKAGYGTIVCDVCGETHTVIVKADSAHTYGEPTEWTWTEITDGYTVTATVVCEVCGTTATVDATVTSEAAADGRTVYTATYNGYTDTKTVGTATLTVGTTYTESLTAEEYYIEGTLTVETAGYYAVDFDSTDAYIVITSEDGLYSYNSNDGSKLLKASVNATATNYICDADGNPAYIPANTVFNVTIVLLDREAEGSVTVSVTIAIDDTYTPVEEEYDFTLTSEGLEAELEAGASAWVGAEYTVYVVDAGTYTIAVDADGDITVETENTAESVYEGGSLTLELAAGDVITIYSYAATTVTITVAAEEEPEEPEEPEEMVAGVDYVVSLDSTNYSVETTITITEAGYYTVSVSENAYITVYDGDYYYYYNSNRMDSGYIETDEIALIPAGTVLNVVIGLIDTDTATEVTALIAIDADYEPVIEPEYDFELTSEGLEADLEAGASIWVGAEYTVYVVDAGTYTIAVDADGDITVETENTAESVYEGGSITLELAEGDIITIYSYAATTVTITVAAEVEPVEPDYTLSLGDNEVLPEIDYTYTAEVDGTYSFTLSGEDIDSVCVWAGEDDYNNSWEADYLDVQNDNAYSFTLTLTAGETVTLYITGTDGLTITIAEAEEEEPEPADETSVPTLVVGENAIVLSDEYGANGYETTFTATADGEYTFSTVGDDTWVKLGSENGYTVTSTGTEVTQTLILAEGESLVVILYSYSYYATSYTLVISYAAHTHSYEDAWVWAEDYASATITLTCSVCDDTQSFTSETITSATDTDGNTVYTATYTYGGVTYTASVTVAAPTGNVFDGTIYSAADLSASSYAVGEEVFEGITIVGATVSTWSSTYSSDDSVVTYTDLNGNTVKLTTALSIGYSKTKGISFTLTSEATIVLYYAVGSTSSFYIYVDEENEEQVVVLTPTATSTVMMAEFTLASGTYSIHCSKAGITGYLYAIGISDGALYIASEDSTALTLDDGYEWDGDEGVGYYVATEYELAAGTEYTLTVANSGVYTITAGNSDVTFGDTAIGANTSVTLELYAEEVYAVTSVADVTLAAQYVDVAGVASMMTVGTTLSWVSYNEETILAAGGTMYLRIDAISSASDNYYARITGDVENITVYYSAETDDTDVVAAKDSYAVVTLTDDGYYYITLAARAHGYFKIVANSDATITVELDAGGEGGEDTSTYVAIALDTVTTLELLSENSTYMVYLSYEAAAAGDYTLTLSSNHSWWTSYLSVMLDSIVVTVNGTTVSSTDGSYALSLVAGENKIVINYKLGSGMVTGYTYTALLESGAVEVTYEELSVGANEIPLADGAEYAEATYQFTATTAGTYTFTVSGDEIDGSVLIASDSSYTATVYLDQAATEAEQGEEVPYSFTLNLEEGETITLYIYNPDGTLTLTITAPVTEVTYTVSLTATSDTSTKYTIAYADNNVDEAATVSFDYSDIKTLKEDKDKTDSDGKNGYAYAYEIKASRPMVITVADGAEDVTLTFYISHSTTTDTRTVYVGTDTSSTSGTAVLTSFSVGGTADDSNSIDYLYAVTVTLTAGDTYYIWSDNTMHLYGLTVTYTVVE